MPLLFTLVLLYRHWQWRVAQAGKQVVRAKAAAAYGSLYPLSLSSIHRAVLLCAIPRSGLLLLLACLQGESGCDKKLESSTALSNPFYHSSLRRAHCLMLIHLFVSILITLDIPRSWKITFLTSDRMLCHIKIMFYIVRSEYFFFFCLLRIFVNYVLNK